MRNQWLAGLLALLSGRSLRELSREQYVVCSLFCNTDFSVRDVEQVEENEHDDDAGHCGEYEARAAERQSTSFAKLMVFQAL